MFDMIDKRETLQKPTNTFGFPDYLDLDQNVYFFGIALPIIIVLLRCMP